MSPEMNFEAQCRAYETVAQAIDFIRSNAKTQPNLEEIAQSVNLSTFHLQRLFSDWAGISPKRFLQFLTKEHAKNLLRQSSDVLSAAYATGLSSPSRLHDLTVVCDAVTPGEVKSLGNGLEICFGFVATPLGKAIVGITGRGVCHLHIIDKDEDTALAQLRNEWPYASLRHDDHTAIDLCKRIFPRRNLEQPLHILLRGTNFQIKVWEALLRIPMGEVVSYQSLADMAGAPNASRAVGSAVGKNNIAILIPCHRVIRADGDINQYRWGVTRKSALLLMEQARDNPIAGK